MYLPKDFFTSYQQNLPGRKHAVTHTVRRRRGGNASDEQSPPTKRQKKIQPPPKSSGVANGGGQPFETERGLVNGWRRSVRSRSSKQLTNKAGHDTCRREVDSTSDEAFTPAERQRTTDPQKNRTGGAHDEGQQFEIKMAAMIGLRGMERGDNFELATNVTDAGNFDDLVYTANGRRYFLQLKHTHNPGTNKFVHSKLVPLLNSCFETYISMEDKDQSEFIIYTNQHLGSRLLKHKTQESDVDTFFKTSDRGKIFKFTPDDDKENDVYTLLEESMKKSEGYKCLSDQEKESKQKGIEEFLNKLILFTGQIDQWELDKLIAEGIRNQNKIQVDHMVYTSVLRHFKMRLENWWRNGKEKMTPETLGAWLQKAKTESCASDVRSLFESCTKKLVCTGIKFSDSEISRLDNKLSDKCAVHLRSDALTLCSILLLDCLPQPKCIFVTFESLLSNKNMLLYAWLGGQWELLIVFCDSTVPQCDISDTCREISESIQSNHSTKRVIILTACSVQQITGFDPVTHEFEFEQLSKESQKMLLDKKIDFQGCEVTMRSVLQRHGNVDHVLGPELVTDMITEGNTVNIGGRLKLNTDHYEPRVFKRKIWLPVDILKNTDTYPDIFAVSGMEMSDLTDIVPSEEEVGSHCFDEDSVTENSMQNYDVVGKRFILLNGRNLKHSFLKLCEIRSRETLHWLKYKDKTFLWKETHGDIGNLMNCIDAVKTGINKGIKRECKNKGTSEFKEDSIWKLGERTVLVVAEPGMGKSSTTTQVARHTKLADPTSWVVRINWNDHTKKLQEINEATFNFDSLVEFLCRTALRESKYTDTNRRLLKQALQYSGNVTVLMDGFDDISPAHADKAAVILSELMKTKVERVWVTSRPVQKERLERKLSVIAFSMKKLSHESQRAIFLHLWLPKVNMYKNGQILVRFIDRSLLLAYDLYQDRNFTGTPGYVKLIAVALETHLQMGDFNAPPKIDFLYLYERLFERTMHAKESPKEEEEDLNRFRDDHEIFLDNLEKCSLLVTLPSEQHALLKTKIRNGKKTSIDAEKVRDGKDKINIVMKVVDGKPQFVHRTIAEYLTARWFSRNFKLNKRVLERVLFDPRYKVMTDIFDRLLAKGCRLHCAVLEEDTKKVKILPGEEYDVNARDNGGRTALHLIAAAGREGPTCEEITNRLLRHGACMESKDLVLQWTAMRYAIKAEKWFVVEHLLQRNRSAIELEHIKQNVEHENYIGKIIAHIAGKKHTLLLQYLRKICADTKWAPIVDGAIARK